MRSHQSWSLSRTVKDRHLKFKRLLEAARPQRTSQSSSLCETPSSVWKTQVVSLVPVVTKPRNLGLVRQLTTRMSSFLTDAASRWSKNTTLCYLKVIRQTGLAETPSAKQLFLPSGSRTAFSCKMASTSVTSLPTILMKSTRKSNSKAERKNAVAIPRVKYDLFKLKRIRWHLLGRHCSTLSLSIKIVPELSWTNVERTLQCKTSSVTISLILDANTVNQSKLTTDSAISQGMSHLSKWASLMRCQRKIRSNR